MVVNGRKSDIRDGRSHRRRQHRCHNHRGRAIGLHVQKESGELMPENDIANGVFWHQCEEEGCTRLVEFDDEPKCFTHSPDEGSSLYGYSAYEKAAKETPA